MFLRNLVGALMATGFASGPIVSADELDGVWQTEGYGYLLELKGEQLNLYETTSISCLNSALTTGSKQVGAKPGVEALFPVSLPGFIDAQLEVHTGATETEKIVHRSDTNTFMKAAKLDALPSLCSEETDTSLANTQKVFWQTFEEHYPFFSLAGVDWSDNLMLEAAGTEQALFSTLVRMVEPLADSHIALVAPPLEQMYFGSEGTAGLSDTDMERAAQIIEESYLSSGAKSYANGQIVFGKLKNGAGYLRVAGFYGYSETGTLEDDIVVLRKILNEIVPQLDMSAGLVLDIRSNSGGSDKLSMELASRFTDKQYVAYRKQAVTSGGNTPEWTEGTPTIVSPSEGAKYMGPIVLLTGPDTLSAAETFTMALMERAPSVVRIGGNTRGAFSDMLPRSLPNGWLFALPNEQYVDRSGKAYDRVGVPPHIKLDVFAEKSLRAGADSVLDAAIELKNNGK